MRERVFGFDIGTTSIRLRRHRIRSHPSDRRHPQPRRPPRPRRAHLPRGARRRRHAAQPAAPRQAHDAPATAPAAPAPHARSTKCSPSAACCPRSARRNGPSHGHRPLRPSSPRHREPLAPPNSAAPSITSPSAAISRARPRRDDEADETADESRRKSSSQGAQSIRRRPAASGDTLGAALAGASRSGSEARRPRDGAMRRNEFERLSGRAGAASPRAARRAFAAPSKRRYSPSAPCSGASRRSDAAAHARRAAVPQGLMALAATADAGKGQQPGHRRRQPRPLDAEERAAILAGLAARGR